MRLLIYVLLGVAISLAGCKKNRLNQPAYLNFNWRFDQSNGQTVQLTGGSFVCTEIAISGDRKEGDDVEITQTLPALTTSFNTGQSLNLQTDVPVGEYVSFLSVLRLNPQTSPLKLRGSINKNQIDVPVRIELADITELRFQAASELELKKKNTYTVFLELSASQLFSAVSEDMWSSAIITNEDGVATLLVSEQINHPIYDAILASIGSSLNLKVE